MRFIKSIWKAWLKIARPIGNFQAQIILSIFYLLILLPLGLIIRFFSDPLNLKAKRRSSFSKWEHKKESLEEARKQY